MNVLNRKKLFIFNYAEIPERMQNWEREYFRMLGVQQIVSWENKNRKRYL